MNPFFVFFRNLSFQRRTSILRHYFFVSRGGRSRMIKIARFRKREKYTLKYLISQIKTVNVIDEEYENVFHKITPNGHFRLSALGHHSNHGIHSDLIHPTNFSLVKMPSLRLVVSSTSSFYFGTKL